MTTVLRVPDAPAADRTVRPRWELPLLAVLLVGTAVLYLWNLAASGWANSFYAAAVQAGTQNWTAFFFGSLDPGNAITVDKPPAALWVMALSGRLFGFSSWSMLAPQALMAVGSVALLWATVRRIAGPGVGLLAGAVLALTPVAVLMFRFNNPDALLVLLMVAAAWATTRAVSTADGKAGLRWLLLAGVFLGFGFLTKMLQAFLVVPGLALAYLWAAPTTLGRRIVHLLGAGVAIVVSAGWWLMAVALWPAGSRPYIGGSTTDSPLELAFGYNGLGRIFGGQGNGGAGRGEMPPVPAGAEAGMSGMPPGGPGGGGMGGFGGQAGLTRLFNAEIGGQISWLLPAALILLVAGLWLTRRAPRTDPTRAALLLWGGWTVVTALVFSLMEGTFHAYYTVALAPGVAALVAIGGREAWRARDTATGRGVLAASTAVTAVWAWVLLGRSATFLPWLRWVVVALGVVAAVALLVPAARRGRALAVVVGAALLTGVTGPAAYAAQTAATPHQGGIVTAGPSTGSGFGPGGRRGADGAQGRLPGAAEAQAPEGGDQAPASPQGFPGGFGMGGDEQTGAALAALLKSADTRWAAATVGSQSAAPLMLSTGTAVMSIGGFTGGDPSPTLPQFQQYVAAGEIHYFVEGGAGPGRRNNEIATWVQQHYTPRTVDGRTVYDLTAPAG